MIDRLLEKYGDRLLRKGRFLITVVAAGTFLFCLLMVFDAVPAAFGGELLLLSGIVISLWSTLYSWLVLRERRRKEKLREAEKKGKKEPPQK